MPQANPLSPIEGRLLEGDNGLAYWCMPAIPHSLFLLLILFFFFLRFVILILSHSFYYFLVLTRVVLWWWWCCNFLLMITTVAMIILCMTRALYILPVVMVFTISIFNYFCLDLGILPNHQLVCPSHHHLPVLAVPFPFTKKTVLFAYSPWHSYPLQYGYSFLLSLMAYT